MTATLPNSYALGAVITYIGLAFWLLESLFWQDPGGRLIVRLVSSALAVILIVLFSRDVIFYKAPISFDSYAMRSKSYSPDGDIAGIPWDSHFTDLRVWVSNPNKDDLENVQLRIMPDSWTYRAAIRGDNRGCHLDSMGGNTIQYVPHTKGGGREFTFHRVGSQIETSDDVGDMFETLISDGGYKLECEKLPGGDSIEMVFALAVFNNEMYTQMTSRVQRPEPGQFGGSVAELAPGVSMFNYLGHRPSPNVVVIDGHYNVGPKQFTVPHIKVPVGSG